MSRFNPDVLLALGFIVCVVLLWLAGTGETP